MHQQRILFACRGFNEPWTLPRETRNRHAVKRGGLSGRSSYTGTSNTFGCGHSTCSLRSPCRSSCTVAPSLAHRFFAPSSFVFWRALIRRSNAGETFSRRISVAPSVRLFVHLSLTSPGTADQRFEKSLRIFRADAPSLTLRRGRPRISRLRQAYGVAGADNADLRQNANQENEAVVVVCAVLSASIGTQRTRPPCRASDDGMQAIF